ncbi:MAG: hypothetical protein QXH60_02055 [Candidatus Pacearchaeota archaeon]
MKKRVFFILVFLIFIIGTIEAEVFIVQQPKKIYMINEKLESVFGSDGTEGWLNVNLLCGNSSKTLLFDYLTKEEKSKNINIPLTKNFLRDISGKCVMDFTFEGIRKQSLEFFISRELIIESVLNKKSFKPNETIFFTGVVSKPNGNKVSGFSEVSLSYNDLRTIVPVENNKFSGNISLLEDIPAGQYEVNIFSYEKDIDGGITNFGVYNFSVDVVQEPRILEIEIAEKVNPNQDVEFKAKIYDQSRENIEGKPVSFTLYDSNGNKVLNFFGSTFESQYYRLKKNSPPGYWNITSESEGLYSPVKSFYVTENIEAEFIIINDTLIIRNIGNVPYDRILEIKIGEHTEVKKVNLSLGNSVEFQLSAPEGTYEIKVNDGYQNMEGIAALTGDVIGIKDLKKGNVGFFSRYFFAWFVIIGVLALFIFISARKISKRDFFSLKIEKRNSNENKKGGVIMALPGGEDMEVKKTVKADLPLVISGEKQPAALLSLKIKNIDEVLKSKTNANENLNKVSEIIYENSGRVYQSGSYIIGVFAPSVTRTFDNSIIAVKTAKLIAEWLKEHNRKYIQKINFGIGVEEGEIIVEKKDGKLLFTPLGQTLLNAKKISEYADNTYFIAESSAKKISSKIKVYPQEEKISGIKVFIAGEFEKDIESKKFISRFFERNKEYKSEDYKKFGNFR